MLEINKNKLLLNQSFKQNTYSFSVDGDVIVPDSKPDVENILFIDCVPSIEEESVNSGQITITGSCEFNIIYASEESDSQVVRISTSMPFKNSFEVPGINSESKFRVNIMVSDINSSILNGRKINLESAFPVKITSFMNSEIDFIENLTPDDTTQVLSEDKNVAEIMSLTKENTTVSDTSIIPMSLPNIKDIIKYDTRATNDEYTISDGKVIFKGDLFIRIYYMSDNDNKIYSFDISLPFSGFSNMKNINDNNSININSMVNTLSLKILPDSDELMRVVEFSA
jgi:hypothetical protein